MVMALRSRRSMLAVSVLAAAVLLPGSLASPAAAMPAVEPSGTWGPPRQVDPGFGAYAMTFAWSQSGTRLHAISYNDDGNRYYQRSADDGATWQDRVQVGGANTGHNLIATGGGYVYVVKRSDYTRRDNRLVMRRNASDGAASAGRRRRPSRPGGRDRVRRCPRWPPPAHPCTSPTTRRPPGRDVRGRGQVVIVSSRDHGATWTRHVVARLDRNLSRATPVVAASGRHVGGRLEGQRREEGRPSADLARLRPHLGTHHHVGRRNRRNLGGGARIPRGGRVRQARGRRVGARPQERVVEEEAVRAGREGHDAQAAGSGAARHDAGRCAVGRYPGDVPAPSCGGTSRPTTESRGHRR